MARKIEVALVGDSRSLERAFGRSQSAGGKLGKALGTGLKVAAGVGAAAIGGLAVAAKIGFGEFQDAQRVTAQTNAVLKSTGKVANVTAKEVSDLSEALMKKSGVDDEVIASSQNVLLTFTNVRNEVGKGNDIFTQATKTILDMSVALGTDLQSSTIQVGKALNDPIKGITALTRVGVSFTEGQKEQITALVESGKKMEAQKLILKELRKEFGGSAKAAGKTFAGQIDILRESFNNWAGDMVGKVMPTLEDFIKRFTRAKGFTAKLKVAWTGIREAGAELVDVLQTAVFGEITRRPLKLKSGKIIEWQTSEQKGLVNSIREGLERADWTAIGKQVGAAISERVRITAEFMNQALTAVSSWIDAHIGQLADLGAKLMLSIISKLLDPQFWKENWRLILGIAIAVFPLGRFAKLGSLVGRAFVKGFTVIVDRLPTAVGLAVLKIIGVLGKIVGYLTGTFAGTLAKIPGWIRAAFRLTTFFAFVEAIRSGFERIKEATQRAVEFIRNQWGKVPGFLRPVVAAFSGVIGIINGVITAVRQLIDWIGKIPSPGDFLPDVDVPGFAGGVRNFGGGVALVGERGPELVTLPRGANVHTNAQSRRMVSTPAFASGGTVQVIVVGGDPEAIRYFQGLDGRYRRGNGGRGVFG